jgi:hypothetical protein
MLPNRCDSEAVALSGTSRATRTGPVANAPPGADAAVTIAAPVKLVIAGTVNLALPRTSYSMEER